MGQKTIPVSNTHCHPPGCSYVLSICYVIECTEWFSINSMILPKFLLGKIYTIFLSIANFDFFLEEASSVFDECH